MEPSHGSKSCLNLIQEEDQSVKKRSRPEKGLEKLLNDQIGNLTRMVDRVFLTLAFNRKTLKFDRQLDRKTQAKWPQPPPNDGTAIPACPVCGVVPHNLSLHDEWRRLPGAKNSDKLAADREASMNHRDGDPKSAPPSAAAGASTGCGICGAPAVFDNWLDINLCPTCGARETTKGWQER
jgi:hypothetical protein